MTAEELSDIRSLIAERKALVEKYPDKPCYGFGRAANTTN